MDCLSILYGEFRLVLDDQVLNNNIIIIGIVVCFIAVVGRLFFFRRHDESIEYNCKHKSYRGRILFCFAFKLFEIRFYEYWTLRWCCCSEIITNCVLRILRWCSEIVILTSYCFVNSRRMRVYKTMPQCQCISQQISMNDTHESTHPTVLGVLRTQLFFVLEFLLRVRTWSMVSTSSIFKSRRRRLFWSRWSDRIVGIRNCSLVSNY